MSIIKPEKLITSHVGKRGMQCIAEPLERGFGVTLGNALRRVLLSSLQGGAVTFLKINGINHEFQSLHGVKEDVTDIVLNIKTMVIKMLTPKRQTLRLQAEGPCVVTAGMIESNEFVEIIDPDHVICTLDASASIDMELVCEIGRGYLPAVIIREKFGDNLPFARGHAMEYIALDALFSPIKSVFYKVENTRVGQRTDYDKLILNFETNGAVSCEDALSLAAKILQEQFSLFLVRNAQEHKVTDDDEERDDMKFHPVLLKKLSSFDLSVRAKNCLSGDNIVYIGDLVQKTEPELMKLPNFGKKSLHEINQLLDNLNREYKEDKSKASRYAHVGLLTLGMKIEDWNKEVIDKLIRKSNSI